jgi:L-alanine-DL-glutamate epimerase-like enolase superfamily enzyme
MRIIDIRCARIGRSPVLRVLTDEGIDGFAEIEFSKPYVAKTLDLYRPLLIGLDPTEVERCMMRIKRMGGTKPWGAIVSAIEPIHRLLGGKVRDRIRVYNGGIRTPLGAHTPEDYAASMRFMTQSPEGFSIFKEGVGLHGFMAPNTPDFLYNDLRTGTLHPNRGFLTPRAVGHIGDEGCRRPASAFGARHGPGVDGAGRDHGASSSGAVRHRVGGGPAHR